MTYIHSDDKVIDEFIKKTLSIEVALKLYVTNYLIGLIKM